ncbi:c-type cytochrome [Glaciimonas sp. GG7]
MNSPDDGEPGMRIAGISVRGRDKWAQRTVLSLFLSVIAMSIVAACSPVERSRALDDPTISANTIALQVCSNCHGVQGISASPNFPHLAAQTQPYLVEQLKSFKGHGRSDPAGFEYMWGISARLTDVQIDGLATYFSVQKPAPGVRRNTTLLKDGQTIFEHGITSSNTPACVACHGANGEGVQQFPRIAGQHADYIVKQLMVFQRTEQRPEGEVMKNITHAMTTENMESVAAWLEAMPARK